MNVYVSTVVIKTETHATRSNQVEYTARYIPLLSTMMPVLMQQVRM
jgi:hypothetical protein